MHLIISGCPSSETCIPRREGWARRTTLSRLLATNHVVRLVTKKDREIDSEAVLERLDRNTLDGKFERLPKNYNLSATWEEALLEIVLVTDRQVTHYIDENSSLAWKMTESGSFPRRCDRRECKLAARLRSGVHHMEAMQTRSNY